MRPGRQRSFLMLVTLLALTVRIACMLMLRTWDIPDNWNFGWETGSIAESLATGQGFSSPFGEPTGPTAWLMPIFPSVLALIFSTMGSYSTPSALSILILNSAVSALTCIPLFALAKKVFGDRTAWLSITAFALYPPSIWHSITTIWDTTAVTFSCVALIYGLYWLDGRWNLKRATVLGAVIGLVALLNPVALVLLAVTALVVLRQPRASLGRRVGVISVVSLMATLMILPWVVRNHRQFDRIFLRSNLGLELKLGNSDKAWENYVSGVGTSAMELGHPTIVRGELERYSNLGEVTYVEQAMAEALTFIRHHPSRFLRLSWRRVHHFWLGDLSSRNEWTANLQTGLSLSWIKKACHLAPLPFMILGIALAWKQGLHIAPILGFLTIFPAIYYVTHVSERYRFPVEPFILMFACFGLLWCSTRLGWLPKTLRPIDRSR